jgi:uncharacterized membrane protein
MNAAHLHIVLVHLPIVLIPTATFLLLFALFRKQEPVASVALWLYVGASLCSIPAFLIGEEAEEIVEDLPGISEETLEDHEEAADVAFWLTLVVGATAASGILLEKKAPRFLQPTLKLLVVTGAVASASLTHTAYKGGKIRHPEAYGTLASSGHQQDGRHGDD